MHAATPWTYYLPAADLVWVANQKRTVASVTVPFEPTEADMREAHATARLICSAPDLLHAAQAALAKHQDAASLLRQSVNKATGGNA